MAAAGPYLLLAALWAAYFALHSLLASRRIKARAARLGPAAARGYRLGYNLLAVVLLVPPLWLTVVADGPWVIRWSGPAWWLAQGAALAAVVTFFRSVRGYDMGHFLGTRQWRGEVLTDSGVEPWEPLRIEGLHRFVRHPWYFLGLIILWTRDLHLAGLITAVAVTLYLVVGSRLEERKLIASYGAVYETYRQRVPGLIPLPGRYLRPAEAHELAEQANRKGNAQ
jgi:protein-S-isoprenylcysteine O-methyltransferase Ste14